MGPTAGANAANDNTWVGVQHVERHGCKGYDFVDIPGRDHGQERRTAVPPPDGALVDGHRGHERGREKAADGRRRSGRPSVVAHARARRLVHGAVVALHVRPGRRRLRLLTVAAESSVQYGFYVAGRRIVDQRHAFVAERVVRLERRAHR